MRSTDVTHAVINQAGETAGFRGVPAVRRRHRPSDDGHGIPEPMNIGPFVAHAKDLGTSKRHLPHHW